MGNVLLWALMNGVIIGGAWAGIVLIRRQRRTEQETLELVTRLEEQLQGEVALRDRLADVEERLLFAERLLAQREPERLPKSEH